MPERKIIESQSKEQAQANIDKLFAPKATKAEEKCAEPKTARSDVGLMPERFSAPANGDVYAELPINLLDDFATNMDKQPFRPYQKEQLEALQNDISSQGILQPLIVRPSPRSEGRYEIIAGHNRRNAARGIGYHALPCIIRKLDDDDAVLQMISTNLQQREKLLFSEKAWALRLRSEALKRQGRRTDLWENETSTQAARRPETADKLGKSEGMSGDTVRRYIRLTFLVPELLKQVDVETLGFMPGVELSYLGKENQAALAKFAFIDRKLHISQALAAALREEDEKGTVFSDDTLPLLMQLALERNRIGVSAKMLSKYFPAGTSRKTVNKTVEAALKLYFKEKGAVL